MTNQPANPSPAPEVLARLAEVEDAVTTARGAVFAGRGYANRFDLDIATTGVWRAALEAALTALTAAQNDLEQERVRLAGCLTAADGWTGELAPDAYGWSPAFQRVREVRTELEAARRDVEYWKNERSETAVAHREVMSALEAAQQQMHDMEAGLAAARQENAALRDAGNKMNGLLVRLGLHSELQVEQTMALDAWKLALTAGPALAPRSPEGEERT